MASTSDTEGGSSRSPRPPSLLDALLPLGALVVLIGGALVLFGLAALDGPIQVALVLCSMVAALIALKNRNSLRAIQHAEQSAISSITSAIFILLAVGALIGTWNMSGTIPTLVYYGLQVLSPGWYYAATALICGVIAMSIGSSWTTAGTIGVGLVGVAIMLGVSPAITAGAVISGAYLGDKLSPLSETTVLTAQLVKVDTYRHIRQQAWTSVPAFGIAVAVFVVLGIVRSPQAGAAATASVDLHELGEIYHITPLNLLPLLLLGFLSVKRVPASIALLSSALFAGSLGAVLQYRILAEFVDDPAGGPVVVSLKGIWSAMATGFEKNSGVPDVDQLLSRGGMDSMLLTLWLIIGAVTFGTLLEEFGLISRLIDPVLRAARGTGRLYLTVAASGVGLNIVAGDQYIALVLPARLFRSEFARRGLAPTNLSRLAADCGTVTSPLVPWNSCGAFMAAVLGVAVFRYLPFAVFCLASPVLSVLYGFAGFRINSREPATEAVDPVAGPPPQPTGPDA